MEEDIGVTQTMVRSDHVRCLEPHNLNGQRLHLPGIDSRAQDVELLSHAMQSVVTNTSRPAHSARKRGPMWASRMLSIEYSADMVLAEVDRRRA